MTGRSDLGQFARGTSSSRRALYAALLATGPLLTILVYIFVQGCGLVLEPGTLPCGGGGGGGGEECPSGTTCQSGVCKPPPCTIDDDCDEGLVCDPELDFCTDPPCTSDADCPVDPARFCDADQLRCIDDCRSDDDCQGAGTICDEDFFTCVPGCHSDDDCRSWESCDPFFDSCRPRTCDPDAGCGPDLCDPRHRTCDAECLTDSDCPLGSLCNEHFECTPGCTTDDNCPQDFSCESSRCRGSCESCPQGTSCDSSLNACTPPTCVDDSQCPQDLVCDPRSRRCELPECTRDIQCPFGDPCVGGQCQAGVTLQLGSPRAGETTTYRIILDVPQGTLETYEVFLAVPGEFGFKGFGNPQQGGPVGSFAIDADFDGTADLAVPILPLGPDAAFVDTNLDGMFTHGFDPTIQHRTGSHLFTIVAPLGGDGDPRTLTVANDTRVIVTLDAGILVNPAQPGTYTLHGTFISVDSGTDGPPDAMGQSRQQFSFWVDVLITPPARLPVGIDIKPGSFPNAVNPVSNGVLPVAILTTPDFDATSVDPMSVQFGVGGATEAHGRGHFEDVDGDGDTDLVLHFRTTATGIACGDTSAPLIGKADGGQEISGSDSIVTLGCGAAAPAPNPADPPVGR